MPTSILLLALLCGTANGTGKRFSTQLPAPDCLVTQVVFREEFVFVRAHVVELMFVFDMRR